MTLQQPTDDVKGGMKMNDTDAGKKRTRKLPAKFQDEKHYSPQKKQKAEKTVAQERNETEIAVSKEKKRVTVT
jgi:hypothetical protein